MKKIAIVHDYIKEYGGAERVLEELIKIYPNADIYTSLYSPQHLGPHKKRFEEYSITATWMNEIPMRHKLISPLRLLSPFAFKSLELGKYDTIVVSQTGAYFPNLVRKGKAKIVCYTHTPPRYLYGYATAREWKKNKLFFAAASIANHLKFHSAIASNFHSQNHPLPFVYILLSFQQKNNFDHLQ